VPLASVVGTGTLGEALLGPLKQRMVELSAIFADRIHGVLGQQVDEFNTRHDSDAVVAVATIPPEHAILTERPWIWGLNDRLEAEDEVADERRALCDALTPDPFRRFIWERASVGHPNREGARAYVEAILRVIWETPARDP
jgi:hypothetical protein